MGIVLVSKSRNIPEVVLVRRWAVGVLGIWRGGVGWVKGGARMGQGWGKWGQFTSNLRLRWTIPVTAGGCQVSRRSTKGEQRGTSKGGEKQGELRHVYM
jgi:hypothetical protein